MKRIDGFGNGAIPRCKPAMDSFAAGRYAEAMRSLRLSLLLALSLLASTLGTVKAEDPPVLAVLEYSGGLLPKRAEILSAKGAVKSPYPNLTQNSWTIREGDILKQEHAPRERVIQFFKASGNTPQRVGSVVVRYARSDKGWRPTYLLLQQPPVTWNGEQLMPLPDAGTRVPMQLINRHDPNTGGFYKTLSIGLASGTSRIDGWTVQ